VPAIAAELAAGNKEQGKAKKEQRQVQPLGVQGQIPDVSLMAAATAPRFVEIMFVGIIIAKRAALAEVGLIVRHIEV